MKFYCGYFGFYGVTFGHSFVGWVHIPNKLGPQEAPAEERCQLCHMIRPCFLHDVQSISGTGNEDPKEEQARALRLYL